MKKIGSMMIAIVIILGTILSPVISYAAEKEADNIITEGEGIDYDYAEANGYVGILTIFSCDSGQESSLAYWGHSWITFTNISGYSMQIGVLSIPSGQEVTIGTRNGNSGHAGIWYNSETYRYHNIQGAYTNRASLTIYITQSDVYTLNSVIGSSDTWTLFNNCSTFASNAWNSISSISLNPGIPNRPAVLKNSIMAVSGYQINKGMQNSTPVGYASGGSFVYGNTSLLLITVTE